MNALKFICTVRNHVLVTNGKGLTSMANPYGPSPLSKKEQVLGDIKTFRFKKIISSNEHRN